MPIRMNTDTFTYALLGSLAIALLFCIYTDVKHRMIYNKVTLSIMLGAPLYWYLSGSFGLTDVGIHLAVGACAFAFFALLFRLGLMGGGDVKLFAALALWFEWMTAIQMILYASIIGAAVTVIFVVVHKLRRQPGIARIPYGVAIALSGLWTISQPIFNHFG